MKTALFHNFTDESFTGYWDGKPKTFKPGAKVYMPAYLAAHYAKHLTNRELLKKGLENYTSPKFPEQVPQFMDIFNKACIIEEDSEEQNEAELETDLANKTHKEASMNVPGKAAKVEEAGDAQVVTAPDAEDEENQFESDSDEKVA